MSNLVERLRSMARYEHDDLSIAGEAADRIVQLESLLRRFRSRACHCADHGPGKMYHAIGAPCPIEAMIEESLR